MRITLLDNLLLEHGGDSDRFDLQPHLGLISLLAVLKEEGHEGLLVDPKLAVSSGHLSLDASLYERLAVDVLATTPDVVGLTSLGCNFIGTAKIAAHLKRRCPELPVLLGGPHASILDIPVLRRFPQFDIVVRGEAELTLPPLLDKLSSRSFSDLLGITYRTGDDIRRTPEAPVIANLDSLPNAAYEQYPVAELGLTMLRVEAGRGCPFSCTFCSTASFFGRRYRVKSADRLCANLDRLYHAYHITHFSLTHDLFTVNKAKVHEFCDAVEPRGYTWSCSARMDCVDNHLLKRMNEAGCRSIYYGVETGSPRMQQEVAKRLDLALFWPTMTATQKANIEITASFITGYPQENAIDQAMTLDLIGDVWHRQPKNVTTQLHLLTPEPGTKLLDQFRANLAYDGHISDFNSPTLESDDAEVMRSDPEIFVNHHYYASALPRRRHVLVTSLHPFLHRLGCAVLRHFLARYDGRLSRFFDDIFQWVDGVQAWPPYNGEVLQSYIKSVWGCEDYMLSLVRFMLAATHPARARYTAKGRHRPPRYRPHCREVCELASRAAGLTSPRDTRLQLFPEAAVLIDIHPCAEILAILDSAETPETETISNELLESRRCYVLLPGNDTCSVRNFVISDDAASMLDFLREARDRSEIAAYLGASDDEMAQLNEFLDKLAASGILRSTPAKGQLAGDVAVAGASAAGI